MNSASFNDILKASTLSLSSGGTITFAAIIVSMIVSLLCGLLIALVYRQAYQGVLFQKSYAISIVLVCLVTTMVIMVISGNLVLSLGMVGALSIVRFRAAIKDPLDIVYMFWAVGVGIANGVAYFTVSITATIFMAIVLYSLSYFPSRPKQFLVVIKTKPDELDNVIKVVHANSNKSTIRSQTITDGDAEIAIEIMGFNSEKLMKSINDIESIKDFRIINYSANS